jgi:two-component system, OmpR family, phosphate regulon response regulator PhoB
MQTTTTSPESTQTSRILLVEDDSLIRDTIAMGLEAQGYEVITADNGRTAMSLCQPGGKEKTFSFDLLILDVTIGQISGLDICRYLRQQENPVPILFVSANTLESDRVTGLEVGGDDYIGKPFSMRELVARCRALIRRHRQSFKPEKEKIISYRDISLNLEECRVFLREKEVSLSPKEFKLLEIFVSQPRRVWSREQLIDRVWGADFYGDTKTVDVHIRWLREKLEADPSRPEYLVTVRGFGYRFG